MKDIECAGQVFVLDNSGLLLWPEEKTAIVADLHLEKASYFAARGQMLPPQESLETLQNLQKSLELTGTEKLILLGDSFHDEQGFHRLDDQARRIFETLCNAYEVIWIIGNHDGAFVPENTHAAEEIMIQNIIFRHEADPNDQNCFEISGHFHPKASLKLRGSKVTRPCFIQDDRRMILPAFGTLTGGMNIDSPEIREFFDAEFTAHLIGAQKIYSVPSDKFFLRV